MQCPTCFLRYNTKLRIPKILLCGHTICQNCLKRSKKCRVCDNAIIQDKIYAINFSLMQIVEKDLKEIDKYVKVCFVGSSTTGKTSLIKRLMGNQFFQETVATIGYDFSFQDRIVDNLQIRYQLWDSAGQQKYRAISPIHYKNADIVVIVYDVTQLDSYNRVQFWMEQTSLNCPQDTKIMVIGNKTDMIEQGQVYKPIQQNTFKQISGQQFVNIKISCKTLFGIDAFWAALDNQLRKKLEQKKKNIKNYLKQVEQIEKNREKCLKLKRKNRDSQNTARTSSCC